MDFRNAKGLAEIWSNSDNTDFELVWADEIERRLTFQHGEISFYVNCPLTAEDKWLAWSEVEEVLPCLQEVIEFLDCDKKRSLTEILQKVNKLLQPLLGHAAAAVGDEEDDDDDFDEAYYEEDDFDTGVADAVLIKHHSSSEEEEQCNYFTGNASDSAVLRLLRDLKQFKKDEGKFSVVGNPRENNLFVWDVKLIDLPTDTPLGKDLQSYSKKYKKEPVIEMEMKFPENYPMAPPFVRIMKPRFKFLTGHVTIGGSICMEMLTKSGWAPTNDIEGILVQIRAEILSDGNTRLDSNPDRAYDEYEARQAFDRMVQKYGWQK